MRLRRRTTWRLAALAIVLVLAVGLIAPRLDAGRFGNRIRASLEQALGRKVEIGNVHLDPFGPGFSVDRVVIHDDPRLGLEPLAYVDSGLDARVSFKSFWTGRLEFSSLRLNEPSVNLVRPVDGAWNFEELLTRTAGAGPAGIRLPGIQVRNGRINFKFGDTKSIFYFTDVSLDASPPSLAGGEWRIRFEGQPARTDRPAHGFGSFSARGRWKPDPRTGGRIELFIDLEKSSLAELIRLFHGHDIGVHGQITSRARLSGPVSDVRISGSMEVGDIHRWDLLPPHSDGWPLQYRGRLDLVSQQLELETYAPAGAGTPPLSFWVRASAYLSRPRWGVITTVSHLPLAPLKEVARHMGIALPQALVFDGDLNGVLGYSPAAGFQGKLLAQAASVNLPDSQPMHLSEAELRVDGSRIILAPALFQPDPGERAAVAAEYAWDTQSLRASIDAAPMSVPAVSRLLGPVPILAACRDGFWRGRLDFSQQGERPGLWSGNIQLEDVTIGVPGLADPVELDRAHLLIGYGVASLDRMAGHAGAAAFQGEYRYRAGADRPHLFHLSVPALDAAELERLLMPALRRSESFLARALRLGRVRIPDWLTALHADGVVEIGSLAMADLRLDRLRAHVRWDAATIDVPELAARFSDGLISGRLTASLRHADPVYRLNGRFRSLAWMGGTWEGKAVLAASGTGDDLLRNLRLEASFDGRSISFGSETEFKSVAGDCVLTLPRGVPQFSFPTIQATTGEEVYRGEGATGDDGRLYFELSDGQKQMRMSGTLSPFQLEQVAARSPG